MADGFVLILCNVLDFKPLRAVPNEHTSSNDLLIKLVFFAVGFGVIQGPWRWHRAFRDPVPFPPVYPPAKND
jgi:hypothetical protein